MTNTGTETVSYQTENNEIVKETNIVDRIFIPHTAAVRALKRIDRCFITAERSLEPMCLLIVGESRSGKSRLLENTAKEHPSYRLDEGLIVPVLMVSTPATPSVKGLAEILLEAIGDPSPEKGSERTMTRRLTKLLKGAKVRMIILDEFQHFYDKTSDKVMHNVADWLKLLIDQSKVSLIVGGLPTCQAVLNQNEQLAGRFMGQIRMPRFDWEDADSRKEFRAILNAFQDSLSEFEWPDLSAYEMAFRFYCATGGLIGYMVKILRQAVQNAIFDAQNTIDLSALKVAYEESVFLDSSLSLIPAFDKSFVAVPTDNLVKAAKSVCTQPIALHKTRNRHTRHKSLYPSEILKG